MQLYRVRSKEFKKRAMQKITLSLGPQLELGVGVYVCNNIVHTFKKWQKNYIYIIICTIVILWFGKPRNPVL